MNCSYYKLGKLVATQAKSIRVYYDGSIFMIPEDGTNPGFDINTEENVPGKVTVKLGEDVLYEFNLGDNAVKGDDDRWHHIIAFEDYASSLALGKYNITVIYKHSENAIVENVTFAITVKEPAPDLVDPALTIRVANITEGENAVIVITTNATFSGNVTVKIGNGKEFNVSVINGQGSYSVPDLTAGDYTAVAIFNANDVFYASTKNATFTVKAKVVPPAPIDPNLSISVASITQGANAVIVITTNSLFTGNVNVKIGSSTYVVNVVSGKGTKSVSGLAVGTYTATATFAATEMFAASTKSTTFKVNKKADVIKLTLTKVKVKKSAKKLVIKATLKINGKAVKGKVIKFKFNKKTYKAKTNKKGLAKITVKKAVLKKLKVGKKVTYQATYSKVTKKVTVKVKK